MCPGAGLVLGHYLLVDGIPHVRHHRRPPATGLGVAHAAPVVASLSTGAPDLTLAAVRDSARPDPDVLVAGRDPGCGGTRPAGPWMETLRHDRLGAVLLRPAGLDRPSDRDADLDHARD